MLARFLPFALLLLSPLSAWADLPAPRTAQFVCSRLTSAQKSACFHLIAHAIYDGHGAAECDSYDNQDQTLDCMRAIRNKTLVPTTVAACDRFKDAIATTACLAAVANKVFQPWQIEECDSKDQTAETTACFESNGEDASLAAVKPNGAFVNIADPYSWRGCERDDLGWSTLPFDVNDKFRPDCAPDTLYSWQNPVTVDKWSKAAVKDPSHVLPIPYLYTWRTPLGTYGYATSLVRIKLKKEVKFEFVHDSMRQCPIDPVKDQDTVYVSYLGNTKNLKGWTEYILCSSGPVASWSHDTPEGLAEMNAERKWVGTHTNKDFDAIYRGHEGATDFCADCPLFKMNIPDVHTDWTSVRFEGNFALARKKLSKNPTGQLFFASGESDDRAEHFTTKTPSYFSPHGEKQP